MKSFILLLILLLFLLFDAFGQSSKVVPDLKAGKKFNPNFDIEKILPGVIRAQRPADPRELVFPGASRFYAKSSAAIAYPYAEIFARKPDTTIKYYLIIKNPLDTLYSQLDTLYMKNK